MKEYQPMPLSVDSRIYIKCKLLVQCFDTIVKANINEVEVTDNPLEFKFFYTGSKGLREYVFLNSCGNPQCQSRSICE